MRTRCRGGEVADLDRHGPGVASRDGVERALRQFGKPTTTVLDNSGAAAADGPQCWVTLAGTMSRFVTRFREADGSAHGICRGSAGTVPPSERCRSVPAGAVEVRWTRTAGGCTAEDLRNSPLLPVSVPVPPSTVVSVSATGSTSTDDPPGSLGGPPGPTVCPWRDVVPDGRGTGHRFEFHGVYRGASGQPVGGSHGVHLVDPRAQRRSSAPRRGTAG